MYLPYFSSLFFSVSKIVYNSKLLRLILGKKHKFISLFAPITQTFWWNWIQTYLYPVSWILVINFHSELSKFGNAMNWISFLVRRWIVFRGKSASWTAYWDYPVQCRYRVVQKKKVHSYFWNIVTYVLCTIYEKFLIDDDLISYLCTTKIRNHVIVYQKLLLYWA